MPSNPNKEDRKARQAIDKILKEAIGPDGINQTYLIKEILLLYSVSPKMIKDFINYYAELEEIHIEHGIITRVKK